MARVVIRSGLLRPDGRQEELAEFLCDWPDCPNIATHVLGCIKELGLATAVCDKHAPSSRAVRTANRTIPSERG